jgi:hypothetical protein
MVDDGCIGGSALAVNRSYLATGSSEGVVNIYNLAAATSQPHPKPDKVRYIRYNLSLDPNRRLWYYSQIRSFPVPSRTHMTLISPVHLTPSDRIHLWANQDPDPRHLKVSHPDQHWMDDAQVWYDILQGELSFGKGGAWK